MHQSPLVLLTLLSAAAPAAAQVRFHGETYLPSADWPGAVRRHATFQVEYTLSQDLATGGAVRLFLGEVWNGQAILSRMQGPGTWPDLQIDSPDAANFIGVRTAGNPEFLLSREDFPPFGILVSSSNPQNPLRAGEVITFTIGDTSRGGPGYLLSQWASSICILVQERRSTIQPFEFAYGESLFPRIEAGGWQADRLRLIAETTPANPAAIRLRVVAVQGPDSFYSNSPVVRRYAGVVRFTCEDPSVTLPPDAAFLPGDGGVKEVVLAKAGTGAFTVQAHEVGSPRVRGTSNVIFVPGRLAATPDLGLYWGSLQTHTAAGGHALEHPDFAYRHAREVAGLDFFSSSEHVEPTISGGHFDWPVLRDYGRDRSVPGRFVAFSGIEWTNHDQGHRHVIFRDASQVGAGVFLGRPTAEELLAALPPGESLAIPHHTGWIVNKIHWGADGDHPVQRLVEIYSWHGSSEAADTRLPIHGNRSASHPPGQDHYVQEALRAGRRLGFTADSDNHFGRAGTNQGRWGGSGRRYSRMGLTGVFAPALTRDGVWEALERRRTVATTGARIAAWFTVDGRFVGEEFATAGPPEIEVWVHGSDVIDLVEILDADRVLYATRPWSQKVRFTWTDRAARPGETRAYYVRARQVGLLHPGQSEPHQAWVSPVWVHLLDRDGPATGPSQ